MKPRYFQFSSGHLIDLSQVEYVSPVGGDSAYRRYVIRFRSGEEQDVYEERQTSLPTMPRDSFLEKLLSEEGPPKLIGAS